MPAKDSVHDAGLTEEASDIFINIKNVKAVKNDYQAANLSSDIKSATKSKERKATFFYNKYAADKDFEIMLFDEEKNESMFFSFTIKTEFFQNEYLLFSSYPSISYDEKAMAFMGKVIGTEFQTSFADLKIKPGLDSIDWTLFDDVAPFVLRVAKEDFKRQLSMHIDLLPDGSSENGYPVIDTTEIFDSVYEEDGNIYLKAYLNYIAKLNKPLLSEVYSDLYEKQGSNSYNYTNFEMLDQAAGKDFARRALRFYTWGVEYTPFSGYNTSVNASKLVDVYNIYSGTAAVYDWLDGGRDGLRENNYITDTALYSSSEMPPVSPALETNEVDKISVISGDASSHSRISLIDVWSSENIAWRDGLAAAKAWKVQQNDIGSDSFTELTTVQNKDALNNKTLVLEAADTSGTSNLKITKTQTGGLGMGVGYEFSDKATSVQSLLLVKGYNEAKVGAADDYPTMSVSGEYISVYYFTEIEGWIKLQPSEYIECVTDNIANNYTFYPATGRRKPGYGIWNDYFSSNNTEFVYSYLILNSPVNCSRIAVVDHRNNSLNITEMAVFSEDPLKNLNHEKYEQAGDYMEIGWSAEEVTSEPAISNIEGVMINGNPDVGFTLPAGLTNYISIKTKAVAPVNHILC